MELLFRKYFWTINLAFLALAALLLAKTANIFTERALQAPPDVTAGTGERRPAFAAAARLSAETLSRVTGVKLPEPEPVVKEPVATAKPADDFSSDPVHTGLHAKLQGATVANEQKWSWAVIEDTQAHTNDTFMVDDKIQGAKILMILDDCSEVVRALRSEEKSKQCVVVMNGGHREYIDDKEGNGPITTASVVPITPMAPAGEPPPNVALGNGIKATSENEYEIPRTEVEKTLSNLNDVAMQARIVPAFKDGVATGFKLFSIRPDSIYAKIGIQNGDVIRRINGFEINSPDKALEAYSKLREASRIELEVERNGSVVRKTYNVR